MPVEKANELTSLPTGAFRAIPHDAPQFKLRIRIKFEFKDEEYRVRFPAKITQGSRGWNAKELIRLVLAFIPVSESAHDVPAFVDL